MDLHRRWYFVVHTFLLIWDLCPVVVKWSSNYPLHVGKTIAQADRISVIAAGMFLFVLIVVFGYSLAVKCEFVLVYR